MVYGTFMADLDLSPQALNNLIPIHNGVNMSFLKNLFGSGDSGADTMENNEDFLIFSETVAQAIDAIVIIDDQNKRQ